jgi:MFS superfamily sulfate permease-like transporter
MPAVAAPGIAGPVTSPPVIRPRVIRPRVAGPRVARPRVARPGTRASRRTGAPADTGATLNAATTTIPCLGLSISLATGQTQRLADSIVDRVLSCAGPVGTVVLDVRTASDIDAGSRAALLALHGRLGSLGTQLRIATASHQLAVRLRQVGLPEQLSPDAIHDSFRSAVLAAYAALPGPGLVTAQVRAALDTPVEPVTY